MKIHDPTAINSLTASTIYGGTSALGNLNLSSTSNATKGEILSDSDVVLGTGIGTELITNGDFATGSTGWVIGSWTYNSTNHDMQLTSGASALYQFLSSPAGWYRYSFELKNTSQFGPLAGFEITYNTGAIQPIVAGGGNAPNGVYSGYVLVPGSVTNIHINGYVPSGSLEVDNISFKYIGTTKDLFANNIYASNTLNSNKIYGNNLYQNTNVVLDSSNWPTYVTIAPGGNVNDIQTNNGSGGFNGDDNLTWDGTTFNLFGGYGAGYLSFTQYAGLQVGKFHADSADPITNTMQTTNWDIVKVIDTTTKMENRGCVTFFDGENGIAWNDVTGDWWYGATCGERANGRIADGNVQPLGIIKDGYTLDFKTLKFYKTVTAQGTTKQEVTASEAVNALSANQ